MKPAKPQQPRALATSGERTSLDRIVTSVQELLPRDYSQRHWPGTCLVAFSKYICTHSLIRNAHQSTATRPGVAGPYACNPRYDC
jgi:hypothetical protein